MKIAIKEEKVCMYCKQPLGLVSVFTYTCDRCDELEATSQDGEQYED